MRKRSHRDREAWLVVEGYRELRRALDNTFEFSSVFFCPALFLGENESTLLHDAAVGGAELIECTEDVFRKIAYRDRPDGLLGLTHELSGRLEDLPINENPFFLVVEQIEKPGNLGTMLRSADAAGVDGVIVTDPVTDINNPNVVRASIGAIFAVPLAVATTEETLAWMKAHGIKTVAATPDTDCIYSDVDLSGPVALVVGAEQYGLSDTWLQNADTCVRIPMQGQCDSLNVSAAATILLFEALRQRLSS